MRARFRQLANRIFTPLFRPLVSEERIAWLRRLPDVPRRPRFAPHAVWKPTTVAVPPELRRRPGHQLDEEDADRAYRMRPLRNFWMLYSDWHTWTHEVWWRFLPLVLPAYLRTLERVQTTAQAKPHLPPTERGTVEVSELIREEASRIGLSTVGFAAYDQRWTCAEQAGTHDEGSVIVCVLEEDYDAEQTAPSSQHERMAFEAYEVLMNMSCDLAEFVQRLGYRAQPHDVNGPFMYIPYAVAAGLGQMGLNGQLLTPTAGSRVALVAITTNTELTHGQPVDYGIEAICDSCQACVRRCPVGAIPAKRSASRGVTKAKIKTERCLPVVGIADGCAVCSKVCPVQRYGLTRVVDHFRETGMVLGRRTDELEGFRWPLDGRHYGPDRKPRINSVDLLHPEGRVFDASLQETRFARLDRATAPRD